MKGLTKTAEASKVNYDVKVTRAKEIKEGQVVFDMVVNGITIYGCWYREGNKNGQNYTMISFPSQKADNGNYYNHCWFKIEDDVKANIVEQLQNLV